MSHESFGSPKNLPPEESLERLRQEHEEDMSKMKEKYPTVESIVDDYRGGYIHHSEMTYRFPEKADQDRILEMASERNAADEARTGE